jgi:adenylate cyclase
MLCQGCGKNIKGDFPFCPYCGAPQERPCASCGRALGDGFAFCPYCGAGAPPAGKTSPKEEVPAKPPAPPAADQEAPKGERRVVTVLFADVSGFTRMSESLDPETVTVILNHLFDGFGRIVRRYDGTVDKLIGDAAMVVFGAPRAHEDDAERAVLAARGMMDAVPAINRELEVKLGFGPGLKIHIGIATGLVVAGAVSMNEGGGYTVMGDAVNLAARLVDLAPPGEIVISESTWRLVHGRVRAEPAGAVKVKGKEKAVPVHRVTGADMAGSDSRGLSEFHCPLVGRDGEMARLRGALDYLGDGTGCFVAIEGSAGVGKSRLLRESLAALESKGAHPGIHLGRCISYGRNVPYYPWSQIVQPLLAEPFAQELDEKRLRLLRQVARGDFENRDFADAEDYRLAVFEAVTACLEKAVRNRPRILVLEDMHWADATSLDLMAALLPLIGRAPVAIVAAFRPGMLEGLRARVREGSASVFAGSLFMELPPLDRASTERFVRDLTERIHNFPAALRDEIVFRSEGIPLFVEEILRHYLDEGIIVRKDGETYFTELRARAAGGEAVPATLQAIISARVDHLPAELRSRLELASVIGKAFDPGLVDRLLGGAADDARPWRVLEEREEIAPIPSWGGGGTQYRFAHVLTQEVVYATLLRSRRSELHLMVARELESGEAPAGAGLHSLAWHFEQAGMMEKAAHYLLEAGRQAMGVHSNQEALHLFERAASMIPDSRTAREALSEKAALLQEMGSVPQACSLVESLIEASRRRGDAVEEAALLARRANLAYHSGDGPGIVRYAAQALEKARPSSDKALIAAALRQLGIGHEFAGRFPQAEAAYREVLQLEGDTEHRRLSAGVYNSLGEMARAAERFQEAVVWYEKFNEEHKRRFPGKANLTYLGNVGAAYVGLGQPKRALALFDECIAEKRRTGYLSFLSEIYYYRGMAHLALEKTQAAASDAETAYRLASENRETEMLGLALRLYAAVQRAGASAALPDLSSDPAENLRQSVRIFEQGGKRGEEARSRWALARALSGEGRCNEAAAELRKAEGLFEEMGFDIPLKAVREEMKGAAERNAPGTVA